jgi:hypothetical protein
VLHTKYCPYALAKYCPSVLSLKYPGLDAHTETQHCHKQALALALFVGISCGAVNPTTLQPYNPTPNPLTRKPQQPQQPTGPLPLSAPPAYPHEGLPCQATLRRPFRSSSGRSTVLMYCQVSKYCSCVLSSVACHRRTWKFPFPAAWQ